MVIAALSGRARSLAAALLLVAIPLACDSASPMTPGEAPDSATTDASADATADGTADGTVTVGADGGPTSPDATTGADGNTGDATAGDAGDAAGDASDAGDAGDGADDVDAGCPDGSVLCDGGCAAYDPHNCGACGHDCLGGGCANGLCLPTFVNDHGGQATGIAVDGTNVYWGEFAGALVRQAPIDGSGPPVNLAVSQIQPLGVTVDANFVYWANFFDGRIMKAHIGSQGQAVTVFNGTTADGSSYVAVNATTIFWTGYSKGLIYGAPIDGGAPVILVSGQTHPNDIVIDATRMYWTTQPAIAPMAPNPQGPTVMSALLDGTDVRTIAINQPFPYGVAVDANNVYWTNQVGVVGNALTAPIGGDGGTTTIGFNQDQATGIAVDSTGVYWANLGQYQVGQSTGTGTIVRWPLDGGSPTVLASGQPAPHSIALDATRIYWTNFADGTVMKLAK